VPAGPRVGRRLGGTSPYPWLRGKQILRQQCINTLYLVLNSGALVDQVREASISTGQPPSTALASSAPYALATVQVGTPLRNVWPGSIVTPAWRELTGNGLNRCWRYSES
jgi:hypothetical protein